MISKKAKKIKPSATLALAQKASQLKAQGEDIISLSLGEPFWDSFDHIKEEGIKAISDNFTKYTPASGIKELKQAIIEEIKTKFSLDYNLNEVTVSSGVKSILFSCFNCLLDEKDEVLIPTPYWVSYEAQIELCGAKACFVETSEKNKFTVQVDELEKKVNEKTKILLINSPNNPSGQTYSLKDWKKIGDWLHSHPRIYIITDDIYNYLVFNENNKADHLLEVCPELKDRTIMINGVSKNYAMTGWRIGWALAHKNIISSMNSFQSQAYGCPSSISQKASVKAITDSENSLKKTVSHLKSLLEFALKELGEIKEISFLKPEASFYLWVNISKLIGKKIKSKSIKDSRDFSNFLLEEKKVVVVAGKEFGCDSYFRMNYALDQKTMKEAFSRIKEFIKEIY